MPRRLLLIILLGVALCAPAAQANGDFYPGGPLGTRINSLPYTISAPGAYYLGGNLSYEEGDGLTITSDHVTLDLMGFSITGPGDKHHGINMNSRKNVEIRNGTVSGWDYGILEGGGLGHRVINVRAEGNVHGIMLFGEGHLIKGCRATAGGASATGLYIGSRGTITGCQTYYFSTVGIEIDSYGIISDNVVIGSGGASTDGIWASEFSLVRGNQVANCDWGILCADGAATVIGNTVVTNTGQTGILVPQFHPSLLDQNTVTGPGFHYDGITPGLTVTRNNAG